MDVSSRGDREVSSVSSSKPPDRPVKPEYVLRGHASHIHAVAFCRGNRRLLTGDADGFVVVWDLAIMRPRAVWRAHTEPILGLAGWGEEKIITHGRDSRLVVWKLGVDDEKTMNTTLPLAQGKEVEHPQPRIIHEISTRVENFCTFSHCPVTVDSSTESSELLLSYPNTLRSEAVDIIHLPSLHRRHKVKLGNKNGMVMTQKLLHLPTDPATTPGTSDLTLAVGYEDGVVLVASFRSNVWNITYKGRAHVQPILGLDIHVDKGFFFTSGVDDRIGKHPLPRRPPTPDVSKVSAAHTSKDPTQINKPSLLSTLLAQEPGAQPSTPSPSPLSQPIPSTDELDAVKLDIRTQEPVKILHSKHSGQQDLTVRSDGKLFATAGWDKMVRVYSAATMKEVGVLSWHQKGCFAVAFAAVLEDGEAAEVEEKVEAGMEEERKTVVPVVVQKSLRKKREDAAVNNRWIAAGSKDGMVSLWVLPF